MRVWLHKKISEIEKWRDDKQANDKGTYRIIWCLILVGGYFLDKLADFLFSKLSANFQWGWIVKAIIIIGIAFLCGLIFYLDFIKSKKNKTQMSWEPWILALGLAMFFLFNDKMHKSVTAQSDYDYTQRVSISAQDSDWQTNGVNLTNGEWAVITPMPQSETNQWEIFGTNSLMGYSGAGGYSKLFAESDFAQANVPKGCLLMKFGNGTQTNWNNSDAPIIINTPGSISFKANDNMELANGKPASYADNRGEICVKIRISNKPPATEIQPPTVVEKITQKPQWYVKINGAKIVHRGLGQALPDNLSFRITLNVNGQKYGYPSDYILIHQELLPPEWFPIIGDAPYHITFEGTLVRDDDPTVSTILPKLPKNSQMQEVVQQFFPSGQFPALNQTNVIMVNDPNVTRQNTTLEIYYDVVKL